jgi:hypothetical protein
MRDRIFNLLISIFIKASPMGLDCAAAALETQRVYLKDGKCLKQTFSEREKNYILFSVTITVLLLTSYTLYRKKYPLKVV